MSAGGYVCTLDAETLEKAKTELNEDPNNRLVAVETFRTWIKQQKHMKCIMDTKFLLRFLRAAKFSQLRARTVLENYLTNMEKFPAHIRNVDCLEEGIQDMNKMGVFTALPKRDREGRVVFVIDPGKMDTDNKGFKPHDISRHDQVVLSHLLNDENVQVNGFVYLMDYGDVTLKHMTVLPLEQNIKYVKIFINAYPVRMKAFHIYRGGQLMDLVLQAVTPFMTKKIRDRIFLHGNNLESVYKHIPMDILPVEYLPDDYTGPHAGHFADIQKAFCEEISQPSVREQLLYETGPAMGIDLKNKEKEDVPQASFMKLNVD